MSLASFATSVPAIPCKTKKNLKPDERTNFSRESFHVWKQGFVFLLCQNKIYVLAELGTYFKLYTIKNATFCIIY